MSRYGTELPEVIVKPGRMLSTFKLKAVAVMVALLLYVYLLILIKTFYAKSKRLDHILEMALETERKILDIQDMDQRLGVKLSQLEQLYDDY